MIPAFVKGGAYVSRFAPGRIRRRILEHQANKGNEENCRAPSRENHGEEFAILL
jgi:hypothetical protein